MSKFIDCFKDFAPELLGQAEKTLGGSTDVRGRALALQLAQNYAADIQRQLGSLATSIQEEPSEAQEVAALPPEVVEEGAADPALVSRIKVAQEQAKTEGKEKKELWDTHLTGMMSRTPGTGKHSATPTKVVYFMDDNDNVVMAPSKLLPIQGADQDIDKESFVQYSMIKQQMPFAEDITPEQRLSNDKRDIRFMKLALQNTVLRESQKIMQNVRNSFESQQSVEGVLSQMQEMGRQANDKARSHISYADMMEMQTENYDGKALISVFANLQKVYLSIAEGYKLTGNDMGFPEVRKKKDEASITIAGLINAATDAVKERILAALEVDAFNGPLVAYWTIKGVSLDEIVNKRLKDPAIQEYFKNVRKARRHDSTISRAEVAMPTEWAQDITESRGLATLASILPNTVDSAPKSLEDFVNFQQRFSRLMSDLGTPDFDIFDFLNKPDTARIEDVNAVTSELNPLRLIQDLPHMKKYFELINTLHQKHMELIPAYKYAYLNGIKSSNMEAVIFHTWQAFAERFFVTGNIHSGTIVDEDGSSLSLTTPENREIFIRKMNKLYESGGHMSSKYPGLTNKFIQNIKVIEYTAKASRTGDAIQESKIQVTDLRSLSDQRVAEMKAGFDSLTEGERNDLMYYALMADGMREGTGAYAALIDEKQRAAWVQFLEKNLEKVIDPYINADELVDRVRTAKAEIEPQTKLGLPFELKDLNPDQIPSRYVKWVNNTKGVTFSEGMIHRKTKKTKSTPISASVYRAKMIGAALEARRFSEKVRNKLKEQTENYLASLKNPDLITEENLAAINAIIDSDKKSLEAMSIEAAELLAHMEFGRTPGNLAELHTKDLGKLHMQYGLFTETELTDVGAFYKEGLDRLSEIATNKRVSWDQVEQQKFNCK